jgi:hypothetical protein
LAILTVTVGCRDTLFRTASDPPRTVTYEPPTSPQNVLTNLVTAHPQHDFDAVAALLAPEYRFFPSSGDTVHPAFLTLTEDLAATRSIFETTDRITMALTYDASQTPPPSDVPGYPGEAGYVMLNVQKVALDLLTRELVGGEPLILRSVGGPATFIFQRTGTSPARYMISATLDRGSGRSEPRDTRRTHVDD